MSALPRTGAHPLRQNIKQAPPALPNIFSIVRVQGKPVFIVSIDNYVCKP